MVTPHKLWAHKASRAILESEARSGEQEDEKGCEGAELVHGKTRFVQLYVDALIHM